MPGSKRSGFFIDEKTYNENSYKLEELFSPRTAARLQNQAIFQTKETDSLFLGRCYTICSLKNWSKKFGPVLGVKPEVDVKVFVHGNGNEFWLNGLMEVPFDIPFVIVDVTNAKEVVAAVLSLAEIDSTYLVSSISLTTSSKARTFYK
jgi:hypothetical protein